MTTAVTTTRTTIPAQSLTAMLDVTAKELRAIAPKYVNVQRLMALAIEAKQRNHLLANCSPVSVVNFCKKCAEAGTDRIGAGGMWAVPFWSKKNQAYDMIPIPDWRLLIEKCKKAKAIKHCTAEAVYENDVFEYERGMAPNLVHKPALSNRGKIKAVYCVYTLPDDTKDFAVMDWESDIVPIRNRTNAWKAYKEKGYENPWVTDEAEQGKKTVVKRALKPFEGASPELTQLIGLDNVINGFGDIETIDRVPLAAPRRIGELPAPATSPAEPETPAASTPPVNPPAPERPADAQLSANTAIIVLSKVGQKGKRFYGLAADGQWFSTFSTTLGARIKDLEGQKMTVKFDAGPKGNTILDIIDPPPAREPGEDDGAGVEPELE